LKKMLLSWPLHEQRDFFERTLAIPLELERDTGKLFPVSNRARDVRDVLYSFARTRGVKIRFDTLVENVEPARGRPAWNVILGGGEVIEASAVILATGGLSVPQTGSDGIGVRIARSLGHTIRETYPALTPLTVDPPRHAHLAGVSLEVTLEADFDTQRARAKGGFLFTHRGYSGPAVLDLSHIAVRSRLAGRPVPPLLVQWAQLDEKAWDDALRGGAGAVKTLVRRHLPGRLADMLVQEAGVDLDGPLSELRREARLRLARLLGRYPLAVTGDEGYRKAEVTGGGVALEEINPGTFESRLCPGLFLCGEMLDAFGPIGGYNFLWSWATGRGAGRGAASQPW
jgi:predicted Rossmann fold flavoprotein